MQRRLGSYLDGGYEYGVLGREIGQPAWTAEVASDWPDAQVRVRLSKHHITFYHPSLHFL